MIGTVKSGGVSGIEAYIVRVECDISDGFPGFDLVGFLSGEVKEAKERTATALRNCGIQIPGKKITVNMSPANVRKRGTGYDLPIALSVLAAMGIVDAKSFDNTLVIGELMLSGEISSVSGVLPIVIMARDKGIERCIVPIENAAEAAVIEDVKVLPVATLSELIMYLKGEKVIEYEKCKCQRDSNSKKNVYDFADVSGQKTAKRGLEIAAAGMHNVLMIGPPGTGKTMLSKCIPGILPDLTKDEALEVSSIYSVAGKLGKNGQIITERPVVEAHQTVTESALIGGGVNPRPGLVSLAHNGVLFLDELPEFQRRVLDMLRQPIEDKEVYVAKNGYNIVYPSDFMMVSSMNPCPCGMYPDINKCSCTEVMRQRYIGKVSKPLLDRMDICMQVLRPTYAELTYRDREETSAQIKARVIAAQEVQKKRYEGLPIYFNAQMGVREIEKYCMLYEKEKQFMEKAVEKYELSARAYHRILKVARTIADLSMCDEINIQHLSEALFFKCSIE